MSIKVLVTRREDPEVEAILEDAPPEVEIHFLPPGAALGAHVSDVEIIYGGIREADFPKAKASSSITLPRLTLTR